MRHSVETGFSFGLTSAVITTLGLMVGLSSGTNSKLAVIGGVLTIAMADALSDSLGIHISQEAEGVHTQKEIWISTFCTFIAKFGVGITFIVPVILLSLSYAIIISVAWGLGLLSLFSIYVGRGEEIKAWKVVLEHLMIAVLVIITTHYLGVWISVILG